jgi:hypothetical protein
VCVCVCVTGVGTQDLALVKQVLYHFSHAPTVFAFGVFQIGSPIFAPANLDGMIFLVMPPT